MRRAALRLLSTPSATFTQRSRTVSSLSSIASKISRQTPSVYLQRRWATNEAESTQKDLPISKLQPTPPEEVENVINEEMGAAAAAEATDEVAPKYPSDALSKASQRSGGKSTQQPPAFAETANATEATEETVPAAETGEQILSDADRQATFRGSRIFPDSPSKNEMRASPKKTAYVGNLFFDVTEEDVSREFSRFGEIEKTRIIRDPRGVSKGFGYITFSSIEECTKAIESMNQELYEGRRLTVQYATSEWSPHVVRGTRSRRNPPSSTLFIGNLSWEMTDRDLNNLFRGINNIVDVRVAIDRRTGHPRGFAHADFKDVKSAMTAMQELEGKEIYGRVLKLDYSFASSAAPKNQPGATPPPQQ